MTRPALLNNVAHKDLRVITRFGAEFGDNVGTVLTFPTEFADVQREYPIFFRKDANSGEYQSVVLLGFEKDENLFLKDGRWDGTYVPGIVARGPFLIGYQQQQVAGELRQKAVIHVDLDHPRISQSDGTPLFLPQGGNSPYLEHVIRILSGIQDGLEMSKQMFAVFTEFDLIEPVTLEVKIDGQHGYNIVGLHTISRQKLAALDGAALEKLNKTGFLEGAFLVLASALNVRRLMARKQQRRQEAA